MPSRTSLNLTYGVELELVIGISRSKFREYRSSWEAQIATHPSYISCGGKYDALERVYHAIRCMLMEVGIPVNDPTDPKTNIYNPLRGKDYSKWTVENDHSISAMTAEGFADFEAKVEAVNKSLWVEYRWVEDEEVAKEQKLQKTVKKLGVEVEEEESVIVPLTCESLPQSKSNVVKRRRGTRADILSRLRRIMSIDNRDVGEDVDSETDSESEDFDEGDDKDPGEMLYFPVELITRVLPYNKISAQEIRNGIAAIKSDSNNINLFANASCGVNVHIGNSTSGFPVETVKIFAQLVVAFEHVIESVCSDAFLQGRDRAFFSKSPSESPYLLGRDLYHRLSRIKSCTTIESILEVMNPRGERYYAYNFLNLLPGQKACFNGGEQGPTRTIEMRQCAGTADADEILAFADFMVGLVDFAHEASERDVFELCVEKGDDSAFTIRDLLVTIGRSELVPYYAPRITVRPRCCAGDSGSVQRIGSQNGTGCVDEQAVLDAKEEKDLEVRILYQEAERVVVESVEVRVEVILEELGGRM
ncbi:hypothetical protein MMC14_005826 [Varicellaria rhodocarpa]|nr:hypothetical protein [Varicellaria rhodocarpa]